MLPSSDSNCEAVRLSSRRGFGIVLKPDPCGVSLGAGIKLSNGYDAVVVITDYQHVVGFAHTLVSGMIL